MPILLLWILAFYFAGTLESRRQARENLGGPSWRADQGESPLSLADEIIELAATAREPSARSQAL
jgi:hypothetical protein